MTTAELIVTERRPVFGTVFFHPLIDGLFIAGGFSLLPILAAAWGPWPIALGTTSKLMIFVLFNCAHFASSTVRFYTKPGAVATHGVLAYGFPLIAVLVILTASALPDLIGRHFTALYLTWSPYHYAAQAYGLALMYSYRTGLSFSRVEKRCLWWICMLPLLRALLNFEDTSITDVMGVSGIRWLLPASVLSDGGIVAESMRWLVSGMTPLVFALPIGFALLRHSRMPLISLMLVLTNGLWLVAYSRFDAAVWATVAHSLQYLLVVAFVHAKDYPRSRSRIGGPGFHMASFYLMSLVLAAFLFYVLPSLVHAAGGWMGQQWDVTHCVLMTVTAINLHHFIIDGYIWKGKRPARPSAPAPLAPDRTKAARLTRGDTTDASDRRIALTRSRDDGRCIAKPISTSIPRSDALALEDVGRQLQRVPAPAFLK